MQLFKWAIIKRASSFKTSAVKREFQLPVSLFTFVQCRAQLEQLLIKKKFTPFLVFELNNNVIIDLTDEDTDELVSSTNLPVSLHTSVKVEVADAPIIPDNNYEEGIYVTSNDQHGEALLEVIDLHTSMYILFFQFSMDWLSINRPKMGANYSFVKIKQ